MSAEYGSGSKGARRRISCLVKPYEFAHLAVWFCLWIRGNESHQKLPKSNKPFSKTPLENLRSLNVFFGRLMAFFVVHVLGHDAYARVSLNVKEPVDV